MGECDQPVVGMKGCLDLSAEQDFDKTWMAREWFVVHDACVQLTDEGALIPQVRMGVETREQVTMSDGRVEDALITRPDHPLVRYAKDFSSNFDLIAERKSAIYNLRELAKASVLAKFLVDADVSVDDAWLRLAGAEQEVCSSEVPQLWNLRCDSKVRVADGKIQKADQTITTDAHGVYGGVQFGLDRFRVSSRVASTVSRPVVGTSGAHVAMRTSISAAISRAPRVLLGAPQALPSAARAATLRVGMPRAQGVDLNLDKFSLSSPATAGVAAGASVQPLDSCVALGDVFWKSLGAHTTQAFNDADRQLLREVFNPHLSDRRHEGELFVPPATDAAYLAELRQQVKAEGLTRSQRKECFASTAFVRENPGPLFPSSWKDSFTVDFSRRFSELPNSLLHPRPEFKSEALLLIEALVGAAPTFDKRTEDGAQFRIYRLGALEVRTLQEHEREEEVVAVFSFDGSVPDRGEAPRSVELACEAELRTDDDDHITKVTEFVEWAPTTRRSYVVLETVGGNLILTEKLADGKVSWEENPSGLDERNALAKVVRTANVRDVTKKAVTVADIAKFHVRKAGSRCSVSRCRSYAQSIYSRACGGDADLSGFRAPGSRGEWMKWGQMPAGRKAALMRLL